METTRNLITTEARGARYGIDFDDQTIIQDIVKAAITQITIGHDLYINSLTVQYKGQPLAFRRGGPGGTLSVIVLDPGESISTVEGSAWPSGEYMSRLSFVTNKGKRWGPYGRHSGTDPFIWNVATMVSADLAPRMGLLYFAGSAGDAIAHLRATFAEYPGAETPRSAVTYEQLTRDDLGSDVPATLSKFARNLMSPVVTLSAGVDQIEFHASEEILCRLPFFRAALRGGFKEASDKKIGMPEDEPETIAALVEFLYVGSYTYTYESLPTGDLREGSFHVHVYAVACKYDYQDLADAAIRSLTCVIKQVEGIDVIRLLKEMYDKDWVASDWEDDEAMTEFKLRLPAVLKGLYVTHREDMKSIMSECPNLADDLLRLVVSM